MYAAEMTSCATAALTAENVRKVVEEEGLEARNLLIWNVPLGESTSCEATRVTRKPPTSPRPQSASPKPPSFCGPCELDGHMRFRRAKRCSSLCRPKSSRVRSASAGRNPEKDLRARYWAFLFENLYRAVDEIYQTCETDESVMECKEAIMMLENYTKEFQALIQWLNISRNYENTPPPNRPTSLAWEVRKSSPGKTVLRNMFIDRLLLGTSSAKRFINFDTLGDRKIAGAAQAEQDSNKPKPVHIDDNILHQSNQSAIADKVNEKNVNHDEPVKDQHDMPSALCNTDKDIHSCSDDVSSAPKMNPGTVGIHTLNVPYITNESNCGRESSPVPENSAVPEIAGCPEVRSHGDGLKSVALNPNAAEFQSQIIFETSCSDEMTVNDGANNEKCVALDSLPVDSINHSEQKSIADVPESDHVNTQNSFVKPDSYNSSVLNELDIHEDSFTSAVAVSGAAHTESSTVINEKMGSTDNNVSSKTDVENNLCSSGNDSTPSSKNNLSKVVSERTPKIADVTKNVPPNKPKMTDSGSVTISSSKTPTASSFKAVASQSSTNFSSAPKPPRSQMPNRNSGNENRRFGTPYSQQVPQRRPLRNNMNDSIVKKSQPVSQGVYPRKSYPKASAVTTSNYSNQQMGSTQSVKNLVRDQQKSGSTSSLSSTSSGKSWADKLKGSPVEKLQQEETGTQKIDDDSEGWETVRRTRCRNSPAKKLGPPNENKVNQVATASHIQQTKIGGFPYSCTSSLQTPEKKSGARDVNSSKSSLENDVMKSSSEKSLDSKKTKSSNSCGKSSPKVVQSLSNKRQVDFKKKEQQGESKKMVTSSKAESTVKNISSVKSRSPIKNSLLGSRNKTMVMERSAVTQKPVRRQLSAGEMKIVNSKNKIRSLDKTPVMNMKDTDVTLKICHDKTSLSSFKSSNILDGSKERNKLVKYCSEPDLSKKCIESGMQIKASHSLSSIASQATIASNFRPNFGKRAASDFQSKKKKIKESKTCDNQSVDVVKNCLDYLYESDTGLTSDDQEGVASHDEGSSDPQSLDWYEKVIRDEAQEKIGQLGLSWGEQMDRLDMELRTPGRALQMHEKLSSPFRKRSLSETIRRHEEKQLKAQEQRERLLEEKAQRFKDIAKKVEEMKAWKEKRQERQRLIMEEKLQRAEEKRRKQLEKIVRKAHDEKEKVNEIAFINTLEAQNKRHDLISKEKDHEARLQDIQDERQRRLEEKAAKEAAAEERRKALEADRQARLQEMQERRKLRDQKIEQQLMENKKERQELASQKARDRELRLSALNAAQQATLEELQKKIQLKQEESARRHEENMEQIRIKAFELSVRRCSSNNDDAPQPVPYETKKICTICNVLIGSEVYLLSHLRGKKHQEMVKDQHQGHDPSTEELELYNLKHIVDAPADQLDPKIALDKERQKALKKRCKKLRQRMTNRGVEYESHLAKKSEAADSQFKSKMCRIVKDVRKYLVSEGKGPWDIHVVSSVERALGEIERMFDKCSLQDKVAFRVLGGLNVLLEVLNVISYSSADNMTVIPYKTIVRTCMVAALALEDCYSNCYYLLFSNKIGAVMELLIHRLNILIPDNFNQLLSSTSGSSTAVLPVDQIAGGLMHLLAVTLTCLSQKGDTMVKLQNSDDIESSLKQEEFQQRVHDVVSYIVSIGIVDKLSLYFNNVRGPINSEPDVAVFLLRCMSFLTALTKLFAESCASELDGKIADDTTQLVATFKVTNMVGTVSLLYGILLHSGAPSRGEAPPPKLPDLVHSVILTALRMINHVASLDRQLIQSILGSEGLSLQFRHIASYLLWYCSHWKSDNLLHEVILLVGYFACLNADNQAVIQAGQRPTVLQQLCSLPFQYFSDSHLTSILFPCLISSCYNNACNKEILEQEMSSELLSNYIEAHLLDLHQMALFPKKGAKGEKNTQDSRWMLGTRFPKDKWISAKLYFSNED